MKPLNARQLVLRIGGKGLVIPKDGWHANNFAMHGTVMLIALHRVAVITQRRAAPEIARRANKVFELQLERVIAKATGGKTRSAKADIFINLPSSETLWAAAMNAVFQETGDDLVASIVPPLQSVMAQGYSKTNILLNQETDPSTIAARVARESRDVAKKITRINDTTRRTFERVVKNSVEEGLTTYETAQALRDKIPRVNQSRQLTIARTELNNVWTAGSANSFKDSPTLTHCSVIGCMAREPKSPHYHGQSTCNYPDIAVGELDAFLQVGFHVNHTGTVVPSRFRSDSGTSDPEAPRPALLDEQSQSTGDDSNIDDQLARLGLTVS